MKITKYYWFSGGLLLIGVIMIVLGIVELATTRILNITQESDPKDSEDRSGTSQTPSSNYTTTSVYFYDYGSTSFGLCFIIFGALIGGLQIAYLASKCREEDKPTNIPNTTSRPNPEHVTLPDWFSCRTVHVNCDNSILQNLPSVWDLVEVSRNDSVLITAEVENLFHDTWRYTERIGRDAANLKHDSLKIRAVCIAHSQTHILKYKTNSELFKQQGLQQVKGRLMRLNSTKGQAEPLTWSSELGAAIHRIDTSLPRTCQGINEIYLFHGTKKGSVKGILNEGFSLTKSSNGLYGKALYFAESAEKSDQYTDRRDDRQADGLCMLLVRVALGRIYVHDGANAGDSRLNALPCTWRGCFTPGCDAHEQKFHSAVAGLDKRFREFLLYDSQQCYPHVLVFYDRIKNEEHQAISIGEKRDIPCYIIGPSDEIQHFKEKASTKDESQACYLVNETQEDHHQPNSLLELEPKLQSDAYFLSMSKHQEKRRYKMDHVSALFEVIQTPTSMSESEADTWQTDMKKLHETKTHLQKTGIILDRLVETLNRSYLYSGCASQDIRNAIESETVRFDRLFNVFNALFQVLFVKHESCSAHRCYKQMPTNVQC